MFNIAATQYDLSTQSFEIYVAGCVGSCKGCHNPELWDSNIGVPFNDWKTDFELKYDFSKEMINSFRIYGGELLEKSLKDVLDFLSYLRAFGKDIWLFTRFDFEDVPKEVLEELNFIKCGPYDETKLGVVEFYGVRLASTNQRIYKKGVDF